MKAEKKSRYDKAYLKIAREWGKLSYCKRKQVGAIIVKGRMIISDGYNGTPSGFENCCEDEQNLTKWYVLHAEANAISKVARSTQSCEGATLYITLSPCKDFVLDDSFLLDNTSRTLTFNSGTAFPIVTLSRILKYKDYVS